MAFSIETEVKRLVAPHQYNGSDGVAHLPSVGRLPRRQMTDKLSSTIHKHSLAHSIGYDFKYVFQNRGSYVNPPPLVVNVETGFRPIIRPTSMTISVKNYDGTETRRTILSQDDDSSAEALAEFSMMSEQITQRILSHRESVLSIRTNDDSALLLARNVDCL